MNIVEASIALIFLVMAWKPFGNLRASAREAEATISRFNQHLIVVQAVIVWFWLFYGFLLFIFVSNVVALLGNRP